MNSSEKKLVFQIQTWALAGPVAAFFTFFALLAMNPESANVLAVLLGTGVILCWRWGNQGLAVSLTFLSALVCYHFFTMTWGEWFWQLGMASSLALVYYVTTLSFEEVISPVESLEGEMSQIQQGAAQRDSEIASLKQIIEMARHDFTTAHQLNEQLDQTLHHKLHELSHLQEKMTSCEERLQSYQQLVHTCNDQTERLTQKEREITELQNLVRENGEAALKKEKEKAELQGQLSQMQTMVDTYAKNIREKAEQLERKQRENVDLQNQLSQMQASVDAYAKNISEKEEQLERKQRENGELQSQLSQILTSADAYAHETREKKEGLEKTIAALQAELAEARHLYEQKRIAEPLTAEERKIEGKYLQLREQFADKSAMLDETRHELFHTQELLLKLHREAEEAKIASESEQKLVSHILNLENELTLLEQELEGMRQLFSEAVFLATKAK